MTNINWIRSMRASLVAALAALAALAVGPACSPSSSNDDAPRVTTATLNSNGTGVNSQSPSVTLNLQDPSNGNAVVQLTAAFSTSAYWNPATVTRGNRFYQVQSLYDPSTTSNATSSTSKLLILVAWAPVGSSAPQATRAQMLQVSAVTGVVTILSSSGAGQWTDVSQAIPSMGAP